MAEKKKWKSLPDSSLLKIVEEFEEFKTQLDSVCLCLFACLSVCLYLSRCVCVLSLCDELCDFAYERGQIR